MTPPCVASCSSMFAELNSEKCGIAEQAFVHKDFILHLQLFVWLGVNMRLCCPHVAAERRVMCIRALEPRGGETLGPASGNRC